MTNDQADSAFQALHDTQRAAQMLYRDLRDAGDKTGASDAKLRVNRLQNKIDNLISKELNDWQAGSENVITELAAAADNAKQAVNQVEQDIKNAEKVVSAMNSLDSAITIAMKLLG